VTNPRVVESKEDLDQICSSQDLLLESDYQTAQNPKINFKKTPITISTREGFNKKVFITKGVCRELSLFKSKTVNSKRQIRKSIKRIVLSYIYNKGTYLKEILFNTPFRTVDFLVE
jgi:hypothetical protein